jgi:hypothetical protein
MRDHTFHAFSPLALRALLAAVLIPVLIPVLAGCAASAKETRDFSELPPRITSATLAGPLCEGQQCRCREPGREPGLAQRPGTKRFELRLGPVENELWVRVNGMVLYKSPERATECFYIDLPTGKHSVSVRAKGEYGFAARLAISEIGAQGRYETFDFACGGPGMCAQSQIKEWRASLARYKRGAHDPCGSTKIREVQWQSGKMPDKIHPSELQLDFALQVYDFTPERPSGHPTCADNY